MLSASRAREEPSGPPAHTGDRHLCCTRQLPEGKGLSGSPDLRAHPADPCAVRLWALLTSPVWLWLHSGGQLTVWLRGSVPSLWAAAGCPRVQGPSPRASLGSRLPSVSCLGCQLGPARVSVSDDKGPEPGALGLLVPRSALGPGMPVSQLGWAGQLPAPPCPEPRVVGVSGCVGS